MYGASGSGAVEGGGATLHPSQSLADLTSFSPSSTMMTSWADSGAGGGRHHPRHQGRQRSGSHAGLLDLPKDVVATAMGPKRLSSPNIALLADRISRAELSKLQRFAADAGTSGTRGRSAWDGRDSGSRGSSPRGSSDWSDHRRGSQLSLNIAGAVVGAESPYMSTPTEKGTPPNKNRYAPFPPSELAGGEASFFERGGESRRNSLRPFFSLGLETTSTTTATGAGRWDNEFSDTERFRAYSLQGDDSTVSVPTPEKGGGDVGGGAGGAGGSRTRLVQASPSLPELQAAKQRLRPKEGGNGSSSGSNGGGNYDLRRASLSPGHHQERSPRHSRSPSPVADAGTGHRRGSALDLRGSVSSPSPSNPPSLPPARPNRLMVKRYSVPDVLDGGDDFRHELTASEMFQQRRVSADVRPYDAIAGKIAASLLASPARSGDHHIPPLPPVPPPPPPLPSYSGGRVSSSSPNRSPSLRRKALETLGLTYSYGSNHSGSDGGGNDDEGSNGSNNSNISATVLTASDHQHSNNNISSRKVSLSRRSPVPSINITDYPDGPPEGPFSPDLDYPQNDLSLTASTTPTSSPSPNHLHQHHHLHPSPPGVSPTPSSQPSSPGGDHHYFKTVSEATSASYNIIGNTATINSSVGGVEGGGKVGELGRGGGGMDDTRSNNTDSGMEEGVGEDSTTWRPYDAFQVSERETEDESAFFREILKVLRLVLYLFIILSVLSGTLASRLSLFLLTSGISQDKQKEGESTVMLLLCICCPIVLNWFMAFVRILFGEKQWPTFSMLLFLLTVELLHTFGVCLLLFRVLPVLDFFRGITVTMATFQLPALLKLLIAERRLKLGACSFLKVLTSVLAFAAQVAAIVFFMVSPFPDDATRETIPAGKVPEDTPHLSQLTWELPLALVLISLGWWENYTSGEWSLVGKVKVNMTLQQVQQVAQEVRDTATFLVAPFKVGMSVALGKYLNSTTFLLPDQSSGGEEGDSNPIMFHLDHYSLLYLQLGASLLVTYLASLACKLHMQKAAFAFPLLLSPLASLGIVYLQCHYQFIPGHWHMGVWVCPGAGEGAGGEGVDVGLLMLPMACAGALWISYCLVVSHIWFPRAERMAKVEKLFVTPHFDAIFPDFHLTCRRRRNDHELRASHLDQLSSSEEEGGSLPRCPRAEKGSQGDDESTPRIFVCATMWHETQREMTQLLKSLFRLDYVHCASKLAQDKFDIKDPDYYDLEIHVIFDDAFDLDDDVDRFVPNIFVRKMIECMEDAARSVLKGPIDIPPPVKTTTPYGGQLVWTMPGQTQMYVHLKNKNLIRHRKRWSQCMYLYYLLGFRLLGGKNDGQSDTMSDCGEADTKHETTRHRGGKHKTKTRTQRRKKASMPLRSLLGHMEPEKYEKTVQMSENTFILTLDGDVDFKPDSVRLLLDRMKKNKKVGAVCGRIHPIGSGPMVWYQQFEYAIGHWLQKASEHVFGCVLCCPGCFSLFRGSALMDDNVMKKYTTKPTEASHFIQFEQGEDRWLCTLLLQQGHRIDYSAGADALTFAPETFNEFFNQRRRWSPSTLANMMDLLSTWRETVGINDNISRLYILYQFMLMASSILAPSTVVLMITGSYNSVLGISMWWSFVLSLTPVVFYLAVCLTQKNDMQIKIGAVLTALYTVVMMIATVGTLISIATESFNSPNVVFLTGLFIIFLVASLLHPQEFFCLVYGSLYFLVVPSTFILLTVYYLCNLNNVSWGTREVPKKLSPEEEEAQKVAEQERAQSKNKSSKSLFSLYGVVSLVHELSEAVRGLWGLREELKQQKGATATGSAGGGTAEEAHHHDDVEKAVTSQSVVAETPLLPQASHRFTPAVRRHPPGHEPNPESPHWLGLDYLGYGMVNTLRDEEREFWKFLIGKYLHPLEEDKSHKAKIAEDLIIIRNNVVLIYVMMNFLWCVIALQLQSMEGSLKMFYIVEKYEPLSLVFLSIFALVLMLQFLSMLVHRWGTFLHLMATTRIDWCKKSFSEEEFARYVVNQTKILQNMEPSPDYNDDGDGDVDIDDDGDSFYNRSSYGDVEEGGMSLVDFHPSLQEDPHKGPGGASSFNVNHGRASGAGAGRVGAEEDQGGIYETLSRRPPLPFRPQYPHPQYPYQPYPGQLQRSTSTTGQFPLLKTIFEQKLTQLQHRYQQRAASLSRQQGRALNRGTTGGGFGFGVGGSQQRYWGAGDRRHGDMRQRFVHQNFQLPPTSATRAASGTGAARLFRGENGVDIV